MTLITMKEHTILLIVQPKVGDESTYYSQTPGEENDRIAVAQRDSPDT